MYKFLILSAVLSLTGCSQSQSQIVLAEKFWKAAEAHDLEIMKAIVTNPNDAEMFSPSSGFAVEISSFKYVDEIDDGVVTVYSAYCYEDIKFITRIKKVDGRLKVDVSGSISSLTKGLIKAKPTKKYCYDFKDQHLQGLVNGVPWQYLDTHERRFGYIPDVSEGTVSTYLMPINCSINDCDSTNKPYLIINNLNLDSDGGNFYGNENVTIYIPPNNNIGITTGSYRVTKMPDGKTKLEISFNDDDKNHLNGYAVF